MRVIKQLLAPKLADIPLQAFIEKYLITTREGPTKFATILSEEKPSSCWLWTGMNGGRCRGANLPFAPWTKHGGGVSMIA